MNFKEFFKNQKLQPDRILMSKEVWEEMVNFVKESMSIDMEKYYGKYEVVKDISYSILNYKKGDVLIVCESPDSRYPIWVDKEWGAWKDAMYLDEQAFLSNILPYVSKIEEETKENHDGMVQGYDGEWRWF